MRTTYANVSYEMIWKTGVLIIHESVRRHLMMIGDEAVKRAKLLGDMKFIRELETFEFAGFDEAAMRLVSSETITMIEDANHDKRPFFDEIMGIAELRYEVFFRVFGVSLKF